MAAKEGIMSSVSQAPERVRPAWPRCALAAALVLAVVGFYASCLYRIFSWDVLRTRLDDWQFWTGQHIVLALAMFFVAYVGATALSLPIATGLSLIAGALFGRWLGTGVVLVAATLGATLAFLGSRYVLRDWVQRRFASRLEALNNGVQRDGAY